MTISKLNPQHVALLQRLSRAPIDVDAETWNATFESEISELDEDGYIDVFHNRLTNRHEWHLTDVGKTAFDNCCSPMKHIVECDTNNDDLIQGILNSVYEVYKLSDGDIRVSFRMNSVVQAIPLDEDVGTPFWKSIQKILRAYRPELMRKLRE